MIVYGPRRFTVHLPAFLKHFRRRVDEAASAPARDPVVDLFVDFGEAYVGIADALLPDVDDACEELQPWDAAMQMLADAVYGSFRGSGEEVRRSLHALAAGLAGLEWSADHNPDVAAATFEGFAYYALYPEQYIVAAHEFLQVRRPDRLACLGLRGIGAPLAHVVAAVARRSGVETGVFNVRPRGHPFDRQTAITERMGASIARLAPGDGAVVDEGPGLSGSSFAAGVECLMQTGFSRERIALFPAWNPSVSALRSSRGRETFERHVQYVGPFETAYPAGEWEELSAGRWRRVVLPDESSWPAVHPQHERRKYRSRDGRHVIRFAGFGRHHRHLAARAQTLADAGIAAAPLYSERGFLCLEWKPGVPTSMDAGRPHAMLEAVARYIEFTRRSFATGGRARVDDLIEMMWVNCREAQVALQRSGFDRLAAAARTFDEPEVAVDGRMLPCEWIASGDRYIKADALDHHADDFLPGPRDIAWDVAGAILELRLDDAAAAFLIEHCRERLNDRSLAGRLDFYIPAYAAYRLGYAALAAESLGDTADGQRFTRLQRRFRRSLEAHVLHRHASRRC